MTDRCHTYLVDGAPVVVRGGPLLDEAGQAALGEIVQAARELHTDAEWEEIGRRQEAALARLHERVQARHQRRRGRRVVRPPDGGEWLGAPGSAGRLR
jgi:hypothetical protein